MWPLFPLRYFYFEILKPTTKITQTITNELYNDENVKTSQFLLLKMNFVSVSSGTKKKTTNKSKT